MLKVVLPISVCVLLSGCNNSNSSSDDAPPESKDVAKVQALNDPFVKWEAFDNAFIERLHLDGDLMKQVTSVTFTIQPKANALSAPIKFTYGANYLSSASPFYSEDIVVPIHGLYADHLNSIQAQFTNSQGELSTYNYSLQTEAYQHVDGIYDQMLTFEQKFDANTKPAMDFMLLQSANSGKGMGPVVIDIDGHVRYAIDTELPGTLMAVHFDGQKFIVAHGATPIDDKSTPPAYTFYSFELGGLQNYHTVPVANKAGSADITLYHAHHSVRQGKNGLLMQFYVKDNPTGQLRIEDYIAEIDVQNHKIIKEWDLLEIFKSYIDNEEGAGRGAQFARLGKDWCHTNDVLFNASDDSLYVSCREAFLVKLDYETGDIQWILGDDTKFWGTFPSLVNKMLTVSADTVPIGQHSISLNSNGDLMLFNNGFKSRSAPEGASQGAGRSFSMAQKFKIDAENKTATEVWRYDANESIYSPICSSIVENSDGSFLVNFSSADNKSKSIFHIIDKDKNLLMNMVLPTTNCAASWQTLPIDFKHVVFD